MNEAKQFAAKFGVKAETELPGYPMMNHVDGWEPLAGKLNAKLAAIITAARKSNSRYNSLLMAAEVRTRTSFWI
jgi:hypothetical protein